MIKHLHRKKWFCFCWFYSIWSSKLRSCEKPAIQAHQKSLSYTMRPQVSWCRICFVLNGIFFIWRLETFMKLFGVWVKKRLFDFKRFNIVILFWEPVFLCLKPKRRQFEDSTPFFILLTFTVDTCQLSLMSNRVLHSFLETGILSSVF